MTTTDDVDLRHPAGFSRLLPFGPFAEQVGPLFERVGPGEHVVGMRVQEMHRNRRQSVHGGMICTLVDTAMARGCRLVVEARLGAQDFFFVTTQMSVSFIGNAAPGEWVEAHTRVLRAGRRLAFADCIVRLGDTVIVQASGQFMVMTAETSAR